MTTTNLTPQDTLHPLISVSLMAFALTDLLDACSQPTERVGACADELLRAALAQGPLDPRPLLAALADARRLAERYGGVLHQTEQALTALCVERASHPAQAPRPLPGGTTEALVGLVDALALLRYGGPEGSSTRPVRALRALVETITRQALAGEPLGDMQEALRQEVRRLREEHGAETAAQRLEEALALFDAPPAGPVKESSPGTQRA